MLRSTIDNKRYCFNTTLAFDRPLFKATGKDILEQPSASFYGIRKCRAFLPYDLMRTKERDFFHRSTLPSTFFKINKHFTKLYSRPAAFDAISPFWMHYKLRWKNLAWNFREKISVKPITTWGIFVAPFRIFHEIRNQFPGRKIFNSLL